MTSPLESIVQSGSKLWLDSVDPDLIAQSRRYGATGATSNPIIIGDLIKSGRFDEVVTRLFDQGLDDEQVAWAMTDHLVQKAQGIFHPVWEKTQGNDGYVSFELDPLLEDVELAPSHDERVARYIELGRQWSKDQENRMIKVPATEAGLDALEELAAAGLTLNVTLTFTPRQYRIARDAIWRGRQRYGQLDRFKSVYSIFVSRVDVYTEKHVPDLSPQAQGMVGIVNAKQIWRENKDFWADKGLKLQQEIIFASTGVKKPEDPADKYVAAFTGSDIQTNPPATNQAVQDLGKTYAPRIEEMPPPAVLDEIEQKVDMARLEEVLMTEGTAKFADPHKELLDLIARKRASLTAAE